MKNPILSAVSLRLLAVLLSVGMAGHGLCRSASAEERALTNEDVIKMVRAGLAEDTVLAKIQGSPTAFDTSVDGLIALKQGGVGDRIVKAMISGEAPTPAAAASALDPGLYLTEGDHLTRLEPVQPSPKAGFGSYRYEFRGPRAGVKASGRPTFLFSLANLVGGLAMTGPAELVLVRLDAKSDKREIKLSAGRQLAEVGIAFTYADLGGRQYEIKPKPLLPAGQYAFVLDSGKFFDFEVAGGEGAR